MSDLPLMEDLQAWGFDETVPEYALQRVGSLPLFSCAVSSISADLKFK